jgi:signal transduction histidine kinase
VTLRPKAILLITTTFLLLSLALYYVTQRAVRLHTQQAEDILALENVAPVQQGLAQQLAPVVLINTDYSRWTDAYRFIEDGNRDFYENNLVESTLETIRANVIIYGRLSGKLVFATGYDLKSNRKIALPTGLNPYLQIGGPILQSASEGKALQGLMELPEGTLLISAHPVTRSNGSGPVRGFMLLGRWWDDDLRKELEQTTQFHFSVRPWSAGDLPLDWREAKVALNKPDAVKAIPVSEANLAGFTRLQDFMGRPFLLLRVDTPRNLYEQSEENLQNLLITLIVLGLAFSTITAVTIDRFILRRVSLLSGELDTISANADAGARVTVQGQDELSKLASHVNSTLEALNFAREELEERVVRRTEELKTSNTALHAEVVERQMMMGTLRELVGQLEQARDESHRASEAKNEFLSRMSHELRTPLNAILGFAQLLESGTLDEEQEECVERISTAGRHLLTLINEVLDFSLLETGDFTLTLEPVAVTELLSHVANLLRPLAEKQNVSVVFLNADAENGDFLVTADQQRLQQILLNLVSNAIKYNRPNGTVEISLQRLYHQVRILVRDTGLGLSEEQRERLFTPFDRLDAGNLAGGTGIGLALSRRLAQAMNGRLGCESQPDEGSLFWLELPAADEPAD